MLQNVFLLYRQDARGILDRQLCIKSLCTVQVLIDRRPWGIPFSIITRRRMTNLFRSSNKRWHMKKAFFESIHLISFFLLLSFITKMTSNNPLNVLSNISECSISGLFQELLNKGIKTQSNVEPLKLCDSEGSDFKRLVHKKKNNKIQNTSAPSIETKHQRHQSSPDFRPVVYLENPPSPARSVHFGHTLYNFLFEHEDRYFNNDRDELSKDIFPVGYKQQA
jgi:hypothetical protein